MDPQIASYLLTKAILAINAVNKGIKNEATLEIWNLINCLLASDKKTLLTWIPSHIGIAGNEQADKLASQVANIQPSNKILNNLGPMELVSKFKKIWSGDLLNKLQQ